MKDKTGVMDVATVVAVLFGAMLILPLLTVADTECTSRECYLNTSLSVGNAVPTITYVETGISVTLTAEGQVTTHVTFNGTDLNGKDDLNDTTAQCTGYKSGETNRASSSCGVQSESGNSVLYNCSVNFSYYDAAAADWKWNCSVSDNQEASAYNDTTTFTVNALHYVNQDIISFGWTAASANTNDQEADGALTLGNGGNQDYASCSVTAQNATNGGADVIPATAFALNSATSSPAGTQMADNSPVSISSWFTLSHGVGATEEAFAYVDIPAVATGTYTSTSSWLFDITA